MRKGQRTKLKGGFEWDALTAWRRWYCYLSKPGVVKGAKRKHNKRVRKMNKQKLDQGEW